MKSIKKTLCVILTTILLCSTITPVMANNNVSVKINGQQISFDVPPQLINGRTMVPMRKIFEELGMAVEWFDETQTVMAAKQGVIVEFPIGSTTVFRNTVEQTIDVPAQLVGGRTLVPVRFVSEFAGAEVVWDGNTNTVFINSKDNIKQLDWNDNYEYWGEVVNGDASGYGALYNKKDASLRQIGKYAGSQIVVGSDFFADGDIFVGEYKDGKMGNGTYKFADGDIFVGEYKDGKMSNGTYKFANGDSFDGEFKDGKMSNGTYKFVDGEYFVGEFKDGKMSNGTRYYPNGDSYIGHFVNNKRHGSGTYHYKNSSYHNGKWENDLPNGYGIFYDAVENVQYEGNYTNDKRNGEFIIKDLSLNQTYYATYRDGVYIDEAQKKQEEKNKRLEEINKKIDELVKEYEELDAWYENELEELYDYITNGNPFKTDWAKSIYQSYGVGSGSSSVSGLDSYAIANAARQQAALKAKADEAILSYNQTYINQQKQLIEDTYAQKRKSLDRQRETLLTELDMLEKY